ncbi:MAG TPA: Ycf66 family protein [Leptolyngbyaceae cyanobacterium]|jgi:hypothetical protein
MVNFGLNSASILGIFLAVAGAALYFMRSIRPELARDQDIFFAAVGLLCGFILLFQGWRLDPILQFGQFLLTGTTIFFGYEAIRLRGVATKAVKERTPIVDDDRPVSSVYRYDQEAELYDQLEPEEERYTNRRLRGTEDPRNSARDRYEGEARRSKSRGGSERVGSGDRPPKRRPRPTSSRPPEQRPVESWEADLESGWEDKPARTSRPRPTSRPESRDSDTASRPRKRRPPQDRVSSPPAKDVETPPADYVDYQPIDPPEEESDNPGRFDY